MTWHNLANLRINSGEEKFHIQQINAHFQKAIQVSDAPKVPVVVKHSLQPSNLAKLRWKTGWSTYS